MAQLPVERLDEIFSRAPSVRAVVVGDLMLDVYLSGVVSRISPEAPVPVVRVTEERLALGGAANVAANIAAMGAVCDLAGYIGTDSAGRQMRTALEAIGGGSIRALTVERDDRPTTTKTRVVARKQQVVRFDRERDDDLPVDCARELCARLPAAIAEADVVVLEDYNKGVLSPTVIHTALRHAGEQGIPVVVDPKFRNFAEYRGATVFKPNALELSAALGAPLRAGDDQWLEAARTRFGAANLLVTLGEEGMALRSAEGSTLRIPAVAREVFDVSGAGDTVTAYLAVALATGASVQEAAVLANFAAGIEVGKPGVAAVRPEEVRAAVVAAEAARPTPRERSRQPRPERR